MSVSVTMPRLGESVTEGTVTRWLKNEGDHVEADEPLLEVSTDKVDTEVPSPASGVLLSIKVQEDETVEIGVELAVIGERRADRPATAEARPHGTEPGRARRQRPSRRPPSRQPDRAGCPKPSQPAAPAPASRRPSRRRRRSPQPPPPAQPAAAPAPAAQSRAARRQPAPAAAQRPRPAARQRPKTRTTTRSPAPTSPRWCASSPASTAST